MAANKNYFVFCPTNLIFELVIQKNFYSQTRLVGLIKIHTEEFQIGGHLWMGSISDLQCDMSHNIWLY